MAARSALHPDEAGAAIDDIEESKGLRAKEFVALQDPGKDFNDSAVKLSTRLKMFQQLWAVYGDQLFVNLHRMVRQEKPQFSSVQDRMAYFMRKTSQIAGEDLSTFYKNWGFQADPSVYAGIKALHLPPPKREPSAEFKG